MEKIDSPYFTQLVMRGKEQRNTRFSAAPEPNLPFFLDFSKLSKDFKMAAATLMPSHVDMYAAPTLELLADPFFLAMESGKIQWLSLIHI